MIPSGYGMVYELKNGEILLIDPIGDGEYRGFIFNSLGEECLFQKDLKKH